MEGKELRIVFMGTPDFAVGPLSRLVDDGYNIVSVVTVPDKPAGRGLKLTGSAVKNYAVAKGIPVLQPVKMKDPQFVSQFEELDADLAIVIAFRLLPEVIFSRPRLGTFNLHASLLPQYRGAAPINHAIMNGETITGVTTFLLNSGIDTGDILLRREVSIDICDTAGTLHDKLMVAGTELVVETVDGLAAGNLKPVSQNQGSGEPLPLGNMTNSADRTPRSMISGSGSPDHLKPAPKIFTDNCRIEWGKRTSDIYNFIRGLSPYPAAWTMLWDRTDPSKEALKLKVFCAQPSVADRSLNIGEIDSDDRTYIKIGTSDGVVDIIELQLAGKKRMATGEFLRGFKSITGYQAR